MQQCVQLAVLQLIDDACVVGSTTQRRLPRSDRPCKHTLPTRAARGSTGTPRGGSSPVRGRSRRRPVGPRRCRGLPRGAYAPTGLVAVARLGRVDLLRRATGRSVRRLEPASGMPAGVADLEPRRGSSRDFRPRVRRHLEPRDQAPGQYGYRARRTDQHGCQPRWRRGSADPRLRQAPYPLRSDRPVAGRWRCGITRDPVASVARRLLRRGCGVNNWGPGR
jgi:hypothetical protein